MRSRYEGSQDIDDPNVSLPLHPIDDLGNGGSPCDDAIILNAYPQLQSACVSVLTVSEVIPDDGVTANEVVHCAEHTALSLKLAVPLCNGESWQTH